MRESSDAGRLSFHRRSTRLINRCHASRRDALYKVVSRMMWRLIAPMAAPLNRVQTVLGPSPSAFETIEQVLKIGSAGQLEYPRNSRNTSTPVTDTYIQIGNVQRA